MQAEEEGAQADVSRRQEHQHGGEGRVHEPVGHRPVRCRQPGEAGARLVHLRVAGEVGGRVGEGEHDHRRPAYPGDSARLGDEPAIARELEEVLCLGSSLDHEQVDSLAEPRRRPPQAQLKDPVEELGRHGGVREAPHHPPAAYDLV